MKNTNLTKAKRAKNDEFYTRYEDIEKEVDEYVKYDEDVFRDKIVLCPCDDPDRSNFTQYFTDNFEKLGLKKLISTCYCKDKRGRMSVVGAAGVTKTTLSGDGDFRSQEVTKLRDEADIIVTNPPFSLFREFLAWMRE